MKVLRILAPIFAALASGLSASACSTSTSPAATATPCGTDDDCSANTFCTWPLTNACGQKGSCQAAPADTTTCSNPQVCPCDGSAVARATCGGFSAPVTGTLGCLHSACTPGQTQCGAGLACLVGECVPPPDGGAALDAGGGSDAAPSVDATSE